MLKTFRNCFLFIGIGMAFLLPAQDIHFSQYYQSPLFINPSYTGSADAVRAAISYKNQWASVASPFKTVAFAFDINALKKSWDGGFVGTGITFYSDKAGDAQLGTNNAGLSLASGLYISDKSNLSLGLQGNYIQQSINIGNLRSDNQYINGVYNPSADLGETTFMTPRSVIDFSAGVQYTYGKSELYKTKSDEFTATGGIAYYHITQPDQSFIGTSAAPLQNKIIIHGQSHIGVKYGNTSFIPSFMAALQGPSNEFIFGGLVRNQLKQDSRYTSYVKSSSLLFGAHYRWADSFILSLLYENAGFGFGLSYDLNTSHLKTASNGKGGVEISLRYVNVSK